MKALNGKTILSSEVYERKSSALVGIASVRKNSKLIQNFKSEISSDGQFYFNLVGGNGEIIGVSETYVTKKSRNQGMLAVQNVNTFNETTIEIL
mgnify:CR=1 FL=1